MFCIVCFLLVWCNCFSRARLAQPTRRRNQPLKLTFDRFSVNQRTHLIGMSERGVATSQIVVLSTQFLILGFFHTFRLLISLLAARDPFLSHRVIWLVSAGPEGQDHQ